MATMSVQEKQSPSEVAAAVKTAGGVITMSAAARMLGILPPNFRRDVGKKLTEIPVEGSGSVYFLSEVRQLARERKRKARSNGH